MAALIRHNTQPPSSVSMLVAAALEDEGIIEPMPARRPGVYRPVKQVPQDDFDAAQAQDGQITGRIVELYKALRPAEEA